MNDNQWQSRDHLQSSPDMDPFEGCLFVLGFGTIIGMILAIKIAEAISDATGIDFYTSICWGLGIVGSVTVLWGLIRSPTFQATVILLIAGTVGFMLAAFLLFFVCGTDCMDTHPIVSGAVMLVGMDVACGIVLCLLPKG